MFKLRNKKGAYTDLFVFITIAFVIVVISGVFIYMSVLTKNKIHETLDPLDIQEVNNSEIIESTFGDVPLSFSALYWITIVIIIGMILSIFIGSYLVTTRPVFFIPYAIVTAIAIIFSVGISNAYETIVANPTLHSTYINFVGSNFILANLPIWVAVIGFVGAIIMFTRMGSKEEQYYG